MNTDCASDRTCFNNKCVDPCLGTCGQNAECRVINHAPLCYCFSGYTGNPLHACMPVISKHYFLSSYVLYFISFFIQSFMSFLTKQLSRNQLIRATLRLVALIVNVVRLMATRFVHVLIYVLVLHRIVAPNVLLVRTAAQVKRA